MLIDTHTPLHNPKSREPSNIVCAPLLFFRCTVALVIIDFFRRVKGKDIVVDGVPSWCTNYEDPYEYEGLLYLPAFLEDGQTEVGYRTDNGLSPFVQDSIIYLIQGFFWLVAMWRSASIGTPTEPGKRDKYVR